MNVFMRLHLSVHNTFEVLLIEFESAFRCMRDFSFLSTV